MPSKKPIKNSIWSIALLLLGMSLSACLATPTSTAQQPTQSSNTNNKIFKDAELKGWGNLANLLISRGYEQERIIKILQDHRMPAFANYEFNVVPREPANIYQGFTSPIRIQKLLVLCRAMPTILKELKMTLTWMLR
jgi:hypothetical protein